ncbi:MAG: carboxypeptidase regulatory-like domain-containing protein [Armatimonadetes bacterium]|nr:carboxypeptidase regulatory-like domain-containing protein [Armatimonadota bacterium]
MKGFSCKVMLLCLLLCAAAVVPAGAAVSLPFYDGFSYANGANDPDWQENRGDWVVQSGLFTIQDTMGWWRFAMVNDITPADFVMKYDDVGLYRGAAVLRWQGTEWQGFVLLINDANGYIIFKVKDDGGWQQVASGPWSQGVSTGETGHIEITVQGNVLHATGETDSGATYDVTWDSTADGGIWTSGRVGLAVERDDSLQKFDNVVIYDAGDARDGNVIGTVTDRRTGLPIQGATVSVVGTALSTATQSDGSYALTNVPLTAKYLLAQASGYGDKQIHVNAAPATSVIVDVEMSGPVTLPFSDTFSRPDSSNNAPDWLEYRGDWEILNGEYTTRDDIGWWHFALVNDLSLTEYVMKYDQTGIYSGGAVLRMQNPPANWGEVMILQTFTGSVAFMNILGQQFDPHPWSGPVDPTETIYVRVEVQGGIFTASAVSSGGSTWEGYWDSNGSGIPAAGSVGFATEKDNGSQRWDNVVIYAVDDTRLGTVTGTVTDSGAGSPVAGAAVEVLGTSIMATTQADGSYTLTDVPLTAEYLQVHALGYVAKRAHMNVAPAIPIVMDIQLDQFVGLDWGRSAATSSSSNTSAAGGINDGNADTGWLPEEGLSNGEWVQLSWDGPLTISTILVDMSGPTQDYTLQSSMDGNAWSDVEHVVSTEVDHTHWLEVVELPSPITLKHLRLVINSWGYYNLGTIYSIECYKPSGTVAGIVRDSEGAPVEGADVIVAEAAQGQRGPSRLPMKGTTAADGSYSIAVPEGPVMVTALADSLTVSSAPVSVTAGAQTAVPDIVVTRVAASGSLFSDNFDDLQFFEPNPRWDMLSGFWYGFDGRYQVNEDPMSIATVAGLAPRNCVVDVDTNGFESGIIARYQDADNYLLLVYSGGGDFYWHEHYNGQWPVAGSIRPAVNEKNIHYRAVVVDNNVQGIISDGFNTYWTDVVTLSSLFGAGKAGLFKNNPPGGTPVDDRSFDNFLVRLSTAPTAPPVSPNQAKANGAGWTGRVAGIVTAVFTDYGEFVIEAEDRSSAIVVQPIPDPAPAIGNEVIVTGTMRTDGAFGLAEIEPTGRVNVLGPLGTANRNVTGAVGNPGLSNLDLLVSTWGMVIDAPTVFTDGSTRFHITDGSAIPYGPTVTIPAQEIVFQSNFDGYNNGDNPAGWLEFLGDWEVQNEQYTTRDGAGWWHFALVDNLPLSDYVLEYDQTGIYSGGAVLRMENPPAAWNKVIILQTFTGGIGFMNIAGQQYAWHGWSTPPQPTETIHVRIEVQGGVFTASAVSSGGSTWEGSWDFTGSGYPAAGYVGFATERDDGSQTWDNVRVTYRGTAEIAAAAVQVVIPPSVTGTPAISTGDYVETVGIAGKGLAVNGNIRAVMIRQGSDLTRPAR